MQVINCIYMQVNIFRQLLMIVYYGMKNSKRRTYIYIYIYMCVYAYMFSSCIWNTQIRRALNDLVVCV